MSPVNILIVDDDEDDRLMLKDALEEQSGIVSEVHFANDGEQAIDYLNHRGGFSDRENSPRPKLILLDLNMPKKDGKEVLAFIKSHADYKLIPVVIMTTSGSQQDIDDTYRLGANSFIRKPASFTGLVNILHDVTGYWFNIVELPK